MVTQSTKNLETKKEINKETYINSAISNGEAMHLLFFLYLKYLTILSITNFSKKNRYSIRNNRITCQMKNVFPRSELLNTEYLFIKLPNNIKKY